jgi:hypothetical protein
MKGFLTCRIDWRQNRQYNWAISVVLVLISIACVWQAISLVASASLNRRFENDVARRATP